MKERPDFVRIAIVSVLGLLWGNACSDGDGNGNFTPSTAGAGGSTATNAGMPGGQEPMGGSGAGGTPGGTPTGASNGGSENSAPSLPINPMEPDPMEPTPMEPTPMEPDPMEPDPMEPGPMEPTPAAGAQCRAVGWATRVGRNGGAFNVTGGGDATPVIVDNFADLQEQAEGSEPRVIYIDGPVGNGFSNGSGDRLDIGANKTIAGLRPGTLLNAAILISGADSSNVILRNVVVNGPGSDGEQSWDNINITGGARNIWIDHNEFWDGQDGNADVVRGADNVTFTWNVFGYRENSTHNFSNLVASSDNEPESVGKLDITLMFNHFRGVEQRAPRCRFGDIHVVNNLFTTDGLNTSMATSPGVQCRLVTENNHFIGISEPIHERDGGINELRGQNIFEGTSGNTAGFGGRAFDPPYEYGDILVPASGVRGLLEGRVGATLENPTLCDWE